ncbi:MAG TPA: cytochrome c-type biogenesis protein [Xanthomonadales bacterium]|nr:cytochrome c-type biogenesis protein [Xanthomonadales bacterium]
MNRLLRSVILGFSLWPLVSFASAPIVFEDAVQEQRFQTLTEELRCLVCQNQNLADSDAPLAHDLRQEIHDMLITGSSDDEIRTFMVDRYGDFVLYRPALKGNTLALWLAPALLLLVGGMVVMWSVKRHRLTGADESHTNETASSFEEESR